MNDYLPPILIGSPIGNTTVDFLDRNNQKVPVGMVGELCIGGLGVTKGYHERPDLTAEKFINLEGEGIVYKTGDLGRYLEDGNIELFGRIDNQVKLRGFRIEPGEIENSLAQIKSVREAVVKVIKFDDHDERLVGFLNVEPDFKTSTEEINEILSKQLPLYMIPAFYQVSNGFPRLPNGKINKRALVFDHKETVYEDEIDLELLTETQKKLLITWREILKTSKIKLTDEFFNAGGNSLLSIRLLNKIRETFEVSLTFREFLENSTIIKLSKLIDNTIDKSDGTSIDLVHLKSGQNLPLTNNQKRLWVISKLRPDEPIYIIPINYRFKGKFNREVFENSINILFDRHHIVYSVFKESDGEPYCEISPSEIAISYYDYSDLSEEVRSGKIKDLIYSYSRKVFTLKEGPLYRLFLIKADEEDYYFHMSIHHIIFDGWSQGVLVNDLSKIYNSLLNDGRVNLEDLSYQQYDYAEWERTSELNKESVTFWDETLQGCSSVLNFPYDFQRNERQTGVCNFEKINISKTLTDSLRKLSREEGVSLFNVLMSAFGVQLHNYSGDDDLNIGLPVSYRPHSKLENIFGMFVNTVVVRLKYDKGATFRTLIRQTNNSSMNALAHQDVPFESVVDIVSPDRSSNTNPLFQVALAWQSNLYESLKLDGISSEAVSGSERANLFDIILYLWENEGMVEGEIDYSADLLKQETMRRFLDNFMETIARLAQHPDLPIESIEKISDNEKNLIESFNDTRSVYPADKTISHLFEEQVNQFPDKTAVVFKGDSLTYQQLNERSNQLAHTLRAYGVRDNTPVGLLTNKSLDLIVGIIGILKAGGGYVPIDPEYPEERIGYMLNDAGCKILLLQDKYSKISIDGVKNLNLNSPQSYHPDGSNPEPISSSSDLAYIMYTSGTTGKPKGSMIIQSGVVRLVRNTNYMEFTPDDRILLTGAVVFDATTFEIWASLLNGGTLYIVERETILDPKALGEELIKNSITTLWLTSALFTQIAERRTDIFRNLKYLLTGGDVISAPHINKVRKDNPQLKVINCYGPTENTTFSTTYLIEKDFDHNIPIGKPISNSTAYIFDKDMNYCPVGVIGELFVGGDGLSTGYLNREDLNSTKFLSNPFKPEERLYRTGDYARWLHDGNIEFRGRADNQLKIRGFRVELEEIESVISEINGVVETVVLAAKLEAGDTRLVAFLNVSESFNMDTNEIAAYIRSRMPAYMIPSLFKIMHGFPKNVNGKTDRKALAFDKDDFGRQESSIDMSTLSPTEMEIHKIWSEALKTDNLLVTDNFFEIGGNSLLAISIMSKIETAFHFELGLKAFFDSPRIKDIADTIDIKLKHAKKKHGTIKQDKEDENIVSGEI